MKKYPAYKDSGIEWIGEIPEDWEVNRLQTIGVFSASGIDKKISPDEPLVSMVNYMDIYGNPSKEISRNRPLMQVSCATDKIISCNLKKGDLVFTPSSETKEDIGLSALINEDLENTVFSYHTLRLRFEKEIYHRYKKYLCNNHFVLNQFSRQSKGTTRQILVRDDFRNIRVITPTLPEQQAIADFLDKKTELIDGLIEKKKRQIELLKEQRQAVINQAVTKGLNPNVEMKDSGIEWIGQIPKHWEVKRLKFLGKAILGLTYSPDDIVEDETKGMLVLRSSNIQNSKLSLEDNVYVDTKVPEELITQEGDILICSRNGSRQLIGKNLCIDDRSKQCTFGAFMTIFRSEHWRYLSKVFNSTIFTSQSGMYLTSTINQLTVNTLNGLIIAIPPTPEEQEEVAIYIDEKTEDIDKGISKAEKQIELLQEYRIVLISEAVTGKIDVREAV